MGGGLPVTFFISPQYVHRLRFEHYRRAVARAYGGLCEILYRRRQGFANRLRPELGEDRPQLVQIGLPAQGRGPASEPGAADANATIDRQRPISATLPQEWYGGLSEGGLLVEVIAALITRGVRNRWRAA